MKLKVRNILEFLLKEEVKREDEINKRISNNMEKIIGDFDTLVKMDVEEAKEVCKFFQGEKCCAFLVMGTTF